MAHEEFDLLLMRMSAIVEAVNAFNSEAVQHEAFSALIADFEGKHHSARQQHAGAMGPEHPTDGPRADAPAGAKPGSNSQKPGSNSQKTKRSAKELRSDWKFLKDLDLHPPEKQSFNDFIVEKNPRSNEEKYAAVVYYFADILEMPKITIHHVGSTFRLTKSWKEPIDLAAGLRVTASRKGTIDTSAYEDIKITPAGRNFIEHELPKRRAQK